MTPEEVAKDLAERGCFPKFKDKHATKNIGINREIRLTTENPLITDAYRSTDA